MISLLLIMFIISVCSHLVTTFGPTTINGVLWNLYTLLPTSTSKSTAEQRELKRKFLKVREELNATSSQDQFAKWAKLRREHDKLFEQIEKSKSSSDSTKATFEQACNYIRIFCTTGLVWLLQWWYCKQPMFWVPQGWFPYYAEWLLSFPKAPLGSVSITFWTQACAGVIALFSEAFIAAVALVIRLKATSKKAKKEPIKVSSQEPAESR